jgi:hypothetical protein
MLFPPQSLIKETGELYTHSLKNFFTDIYESVSTACKHLYLTQVVTLFSPYFYSAWAEFEIIFSPSKAKTAFGTTTYQQTVEVETMEMDVVVDVVVDVVTKNNFGSLHVKITVTSMQTYLFC